MVPTSTLPLITGCNTVSKGPDIFFWPPRVIGTRMSVAGSYLHTLKRVYIGSYFIHIYSNLFVFIHIDFETLWDLSLVARPHRYLRINGKKTRRSRPASTTSVYIGLDCTNTHKTTAVILEPAIRLVSPIF